MQGKFKDTRPEYTDIQLRTSIVERRKKKPNLVVQLIPEQILARKLFTNVIREGVNKRDGVANGQTILVARNKAGNLNLKIFSALHLRNKKANKSFSFQPATCFISNLNFERLTF